MESQQRVNECRFACSVWSEKANATAAQFAVESLQDEPAAQLHLKVIEFDNGAHQLSIRFQGLVCSISHRICSISHGENVVHRSSCEDLLECESKEAAGAGQLDAVRLAVNVYQAGPDVCE